MNGIGTNTDKKIAFEYFKKSAKRGYSAGINNLGNSYQYGIGTDINKRKAFELYQKAANLDNMEAQYNLAYMYEIGDEIEKDIDQAIFW